jgi:hypothetical protein
MGDSHDSSQFDPDAPLRLSIAAKLAFPDGSMTASGLRREAARGRLRIERIANKDFVTLAEIKRMRELCRVQAKEPVYLNDGHDIEMENSPTKPSGSSRTEIAISPQDALRIRLKQNRLQRPSKP